MRLRIALDYTKGQYTCQICPSKPRNFFVEPQDFTILKGESREVEDSFRLFNRTEYLSNLSFKAKKLFCRTPRFTILKG